LTNLPMQIKASDIEVGHLAIGIINMKTGKQGVKHLYSEAYEEMWPRDEYPEYYKDDVPVD
jgi:hypothetical protein